MVRATADAGRAAREAASRPPRANPIALARWSPSAPLPRVRFAVAGLHEGAVRRMARLASDTSPAGRSQEHRAMSGQDAELEQLRHGISCAALLERGQPAWSLDKRGSTRRALKYRRGPGEVVIVNHDGRGLRCLRTAASAGRHGLE